MITFNVTGENTITHYHNWPHIPNDLYRVLIIRVSESEKTNALLNLISHQEKYQF